MSMGICTARTSDGLSNGNGSFYGKIYQSNENKKNEDRIFSLDNEGDLSYILKDIMQDFENIDNQSISTLIMDIFNPITKLFMTIKNTNRKIDISSTNVFSLAV